MQRNVVIATIAAVALIGGGTATAIVVTGDDETVAKKTAAVSNDDNNRDDVDNTDDTAQDRAEDQAARATDEDAGDKAENAADVIRAALKHTTGTAVSADLDDEDDGGPAVWDVDVLAKNSTWHSIQIDPDTGKVLGSHVEHEDDTAQVRAALKGTSVSAEEAAKAAAAKGTVTSVGLDEDGPSQTWDAETRATGGTEREWNVDLKTAQVTADKSSDQGSADDDADDDGSDG
ncbi:PepSY domain-containing protein [Streptomyces pseudoechinosporeus]